MTTLGHISASYLLSQTPTLWGSPLSSLGTIIVTLSGYIVDVDILFAGFVLKNRASHHLLPTHTPLFVLLVSLVGFILFGESLSRQVLILSALSMFIHLVLDDIGYWFYKLGWQLESRVPQIFWFYPFDKRRNKFMKNKILIKSDSDAINNYMSKARINLILELILGLSALFVFIK